MFTIAINGVLGMVVMLGLKFGNLASWGWALFWGVLAFIVAQMVVGLYIQRLIKVHISRIEALLKSGQTRMQKKVNFWQSRPPGSLKQAQTELERDQRALVESALEATRSLERFERWSPLIGRQIATMRLQFHWMLKDFKKVDHYMPKALFMDPLSAAIKLARMYMLDEEEGMALFFEKQTKRLRYGQGAILYALYAWVLVQRKDIDGAHKTLLKALEKMENEVIKRNSEHLANNRISQFNNAGFGDEWYALHLEQPKIKMQRQRQPTFGRPF